MRFLVFNLVVFLSIGYLFTAAPGQSVGNWLDSTINSFSNVMTDQSETESDKKPDVLLSSKPKFVNHSDSDSTNVETLTGLSSDKGSNQVTVEKIQKTISDAINANLRQIVSSLHLPDRQSADTVKLNQASEVTTSTGAQQTKPIKSVSPTKNESGSIVAKTVEPAKKPLQQSTAESETALAQAFRELYPVETSETTIPDAALPTNKTQQTPIFMSPNDRQQALSELIQNLQLTYVTRAGN